MDDLKPRKDEIKALVTMIVQEQQAGGDSNDVDDSDGDDRDGGGDDDDDVEAPSRTKAATKETTSWHLSPQLMEFLGTSESFMPFKEVRLPGGSMRCQTDQDLTLFSTFHP